MAAKKKPINTKVIKKVEATAPRNSPGIKPTAKTGMAGPLPKGSKIIKGDECR